MAKQTLTAVERNLVKQWLPFAKRGEAGWVYSPVTAVLQWSTPTLLDDFACWRRTQGDTESVLQVRLSAVRSLHSLAWHLGILSEKQCKALGVRKYKPQDGRCALSDDQVIAMLDAVDSETLLGKRDMVVLMLLLFAGFRKSEVVAVRLADLVLVEGSRLFLVVRGKRDARRILVHPALQAALEAYLEAGGKVIGGDGHLVERTQADALTGKALNAHEVTRIVARYADGCSPDDLRRACGRKAYENGVPLEMVQVLLGIKNVAACLRYLGVNEEHVPTAGDGVVGVIGYG